MLFYLTATLYCILSKRPFSSIEWWGIVLIIVMANGIQEQMWPKFPDIHLTVGGKPGKKSQPENWSDQE